MIFLETDITVFSILNKPNREVEQTCFALKCYHLPS